MIQKKICMVGAFGVGKTSLVSRFVHSIFSEKYQTTVGVKIDKKQLVVGGQEVMLMLWDLAGEDALTQVRPAQLRGASGDLLVVDGCRRSTLDVAVDLQSRVSGAVGGVPFIVIFNKADLRDSWEVAEADVEQTRQRGWPVLLASAKSGEGVEEAFSQIAASMLQEQNVGNAAAGA